MKGQPVPANAGLVGRAWQTRKPVYAASTADCPDCLRCQAAGRSGMAAGLTMPVLSGFAVVAGEVKDLARETAEATKKVADQIAGIQSSAESVSAGIHTTSDTIGRMDVVQTRINEVLEEQATMARLLDHR